MISQSQNWYSKANQKGRLQGTLASVEDAVKAAKGPLSAWVHSTNQFHYICSATLCQPSVCQLTVCLQPIKRQAPRLRGNPKLQGSSCQGPSFGERGGMEKNISPKCHDSVARSLCRSPALWLPPSPGHAEVPPLFLCSQMTQTGHLGKT